MLNFAWRHLVGDPLASAQAAAQRLGIPLAFVIVSANALSSTAYASEEVLIILKGTGEAGRAYATLIAVAIVALIFLVVVAYDHVIRAYPKGGGAYVVARENLGVVSGVLAAASLLVDYTLTVSVSATAGVAALASAFPRLATVQVELAVLVIGGLTVINLRGVRESARFLAFPCLLLHRQPYCHGRRRGVSVLDRGGTGDSDPARAGSRHTGNRGAPSAAGLLFRMCSLDRN
ncbi:MAG: amino acid permease [Chloroflexota bacterium]